MEIDITEPETTEPPVEGAVSTETIEGVEQLRVALTDAQRIELGEAAAVAQAKIDSLERQLDGVKKEIQGELKTHELALHSKLGTLRDGYVYDAVKVVTVRDYQQGTLTKTRLDTGEVYFARALTGDEMQLQLQLQAERTEIPEPAPTEPPEPGEVLS